MIKYYLENDEWELKRGTDGASGYDLRAHLGTPREMNPGERWLVSTGLFIEMPKGVAGFVCSRSGLAINQGVIVLNAPGIIDSDYRGEVKVSLINLSKSSYVIQPGDKIAQLLFMATLIDRWVNDDHIIGFNNAIDQGFMRVDSRSMLTDTERGTGGHGSTGR